MSKSNHPGSRKVKKIVENAWSEEVMLEAINKIQRTPGLSIRKVAKDFGLHKRTNRKMENFFKKLVENVHFQLTKKKVWQSV